MLTNAENSVQILDIKIMPFTLLPLLNLVIFITLVKSIEVIP